MLKKLPSKSYSFRNIVSMGFAAKTFERILHQLESYTLQNGLTSSKVKTEPFINPAPPMTLITKQFDSNKSASICIHFKKPGHQPANCWVKYPERAPKTAAAHLTVQDNYNQLSNQLTSTEQGDFSYFQTADGVRHHINEIKFENVKYH